jgi:hypothetical protein
MATEIASASPTMYHKNARTQESTRDGYTLAKADADVARTQRQLTLAVRRRDGIAEHQAGKERLAPEESRDRLLRSERDKWQSAKRMDIAKVRNLEKARAFPRYRIWQLIYREWQKAGFPIDGVPIAVDALTERVGLSNRQVIRHLEALRDDGDLARTSRGAGRGGAASRYTFPDFPGEITENFEVRTVADMAVNT